MSGHLWGVSELNGDKYLIVTQSNNEQHVRDLFGEVFGSSTNIYEVKYLSFVHAVQL